MCMQQVEEESSEMIEEPALMEEPLGTIVEEPM